MPDQPINKQTLKIAYLADLIGADIPRDLIKVSIKDQDIDVLDVKQAAETTDDADITDIGGRTQSAVDVANKIDQIEDALTSVGGDQLRVDLENYNGGTLPTEQQSPVGIEGSGGSQLDPATQALEAALKSNDTDEFVSRISGADGAEVQEVALDTAANATDVGLVTYLAKALSTIGNDELRVDVQSSGIQVPTDQQDALEKSNLNYGADIETDAQVELQVDGYSTAEVKFLNASSSTDVTVEGSWDGTNYHSIDSQTGVTSHENTYTQVTAKYVRVTVTGTGTAGDTADVIIGAVP